MSLQSTALHNLSARELGEAYAAKELSPVDVADAVIERIEAREPVLNALYQFEPEAVRKDAKASERRWMDGTARGPLDGVPMTVKENIARAGVPMPSGTALSHPKIPQVNAPATDRILEAGGVIVGSTVMPDWGMLSSGVSSLHGITRSAWNPAWTTGGSSSGAGSAAAAGYGPLHVGTDIGGSIRLPGTWQGLATLKPSAGLIPLDVPYIGRAAGPMCRTVADAALFMTVLAQPDIRDYTARPYPAMDWNVDGGRGLDVASLRVALQTDAGAGADPDPEVLAAVEAAAAVFADAGATVERIGPLINQDMLDGLDNFWRTRSWADYQALTPAEQEKVLPYIARWCSRGADFDGAQTIRNFHSIDRMQQATIAATANYDVVLSPVAPMAAFPAEQPMPVDDPDRTMAHIAFTVPYNMSGQPAATVNCGFTADGRPIGLQLAGRVGADDHILRATAWYEAARPASAAPDWASLD
ncbi:amidase [Arthrobacter crystallopoietes BAB-32]|uniref:Amidase n=1 Tax=Arthrobacter crystallopoietes BAB-32 TaxID=1246476 RepID=N1UXF2_9MICC|nr:amidase [Arthrobacter crystallopoietes]EMY35076.1 amidase [Arthrobacter crystallopoietes BAB-32]